MRKLKKEKKAARTRHTACRDVPMRAYLPRMLCLQMGAGVDACARACLSFGGENGVPFTGTIVLVTWTTSWTTSSSGTLWLLRRVLLQRCEDCFVEPLRQRRVAFVYTSDPHLQFHVAVPRTRAREWMACAKLLSHMYCRIGNTQLRLIDCLWLVGLPRWCAAAFIGNCGHAPINFHAGITAHTPKS